MEPWIHVSMDPCIHGSWTSYWPLIDFLLTAYLNYWPCYWPCYWIVLWITDQPINNLSSIPRWFDRWNPKRVSNWRSMIVYITSIVLCNWGSICLGSEASLHDCWRNVLNKWSLHNLGAKFCATPWRRDLPRQAQKGPILKTAIKIAKPKTNLPIGPPGGQNHIWVCRNILDQHGGSPIARWGQTHCFWSFMNYYIYPHYPF